MPRGRSHRVKNSHTRTHRCPEHRTGGIIDERGEKKLHNRPRRGRPDEQLESDCENDERKSYRPPAIDGPNVPGGWHIKNQERNKCGGK